MSEFISLLLVVGLSLFAGRYIQLKIQDEKNQVTYYERKMAESLQRYNDSIDAGDTQKQAEHMREYLNYERMSKMIMG